MNNDEMFSQSTADKTSELMLRGMNRILDNVFSRQDEDNIRNDNGHKKLEDLSRIAEGAD